MYLFQLRKVLSESERCFEQRCHDPDCRNFASERFPLPPLLFEPEVDAALWQSLA